MISNFFVLSPRGDTILAKQYRQSHKLGTPELGAHERSHTEALFRRIKFWNDVATPTTSTTTALFAETDNSTATTNAAATEVFSAEPESNNSSSANEGGSGSGASGGGGIGIVPALAGDAPPVLLMPDGLTYFHVKRNGLIFGASSARNVSPNTVIELLSTIARIFKDYCGTLSEEALRKNFILCYELLDEMMDYGYPQVTRTENLKSFVYNEPICVEHIASTGNMVNPKTASANAVHKPVISSISASGKRSNAGGGAGGGGSDKNEIFVDILERLNVLFSNNGYVINSTIDGCIQMKSYLAGNPELRLALNEDLVIGKDNAAAAKRLSGSIVAVDDMNFNECVNLSEFESSRTLSFIPPDGEFVVLNYRITGEFATPFRIFPSMEESPTEPKKIELTILLRGEMAHQHFGANVSVEIPLPSAVISASCSLITAPGTGYAHAELVQSSVGSGKDSSASGSGDSSSDMTRKRIVWTMKKFVGGGEQTLRAKLTLDRPVSMQMRRQFGPINMCFEIPMYNVSNLQVRYLRVAEHMVGYTPYRWVRYVTQSSSYVCRL